ncbi:hypothetical protein ERO13_D03G138100v2 [Gossypium hirsutum]|nr:hypothetical protein ERO13_D03G138100v2 [Gossypium hirsutum]
MATLRRVRRKRYCWRCGVQGVARVEAQLARMVATVAAPVCCGAEAEKLGVFFFGFRLIWAWVNWRVLGWG